MSTQPKNEERIEGEEFIISREFNAPRERVFSLCSDPKHLIHWWGPKGFTMKVAKMEFSPGGMFLYGLSAPAGHPMGGEMWGRFVYQEIVKPEKIAFISGFADPSGQLTRHPMAPTWPLETHNMQTFSDNSGKTTLKLVAKPINATYDERLTFMKGHSSMKQGFGGTFDQLEAYLKTL